MISRRGFLGTSVASATIASTTDGLGLAALVKNGEVTPLELAQAAVHNAPALNPDLNAITTPT